MSVRVVLSGIATILLTSSASAIVIGGSNLGPLGYPSHRCTAPYNKPIEPYQFNYQWEIDQYNMEVDRYNRDLEWYFDCIKEYIENANNDVQRIQEEVDSAIMEANAI